MLNKSGSDEVERSVDSAADDKSSSTPLLKVRGKHLKPASATSTPTEPHITLEVIPNSFNFKSITILFFFFS